jgi:hypothetical protein
MRTSAHRTADERYASRVVRSPAVKFRIDIPEDVALLEKLRSLPDYSAWVRSHLAALPATHFPDKSTDSRT